MCIKQTKNNLAISLTVFCRDMDDVFSLFTRLDWINLKYEPLAPP